MYLWVSFSLYLVILLFGGYRRISSIFVICYLLGFSFISSSIIKFLNYCWLCSRICIKQSFKKQLKPRWMLFSPERIYIYLFLPNPKRDYKSGIIFVCDYPWDLLGHSDDSNVGCSLNRDGMFLTLFPRVKLFRFPVYILRGLPGHHHNMELSLFFFFFKQMRWWRVFSLSTSSSWSANRTRAQIVLISNLFKLLLTQFSPVEKEINWI